MNKIISYVGFAIKSNTIIKGLDDLIKNRKRIGIILASSDLRSNSYEKLKQFSISQGIEFKVLPSDEFEKLNLTGVKVFGIQDPNLALAIKKELANNSL